MKKYFLSALAFTLLLASCKQTETKIETSENPDGSVTTTTIETQKSTGLDSAKIQSTMEKAREQLNAAGEKIDEAADKTGDQLEKAGAEIKASAEKGADKVERSAEKAKEDFKKK